MRPAAEQAAQALREEILSGAIASGARLGEAELAGRLRVSRTPIREALTRLAAEGLVELQPNRGARVATWSAGELRDIFDLRLRLEPYAVRLAVPKLSADQLDDLQELAESMLRNGKPGRAQDLSPIVEANRRFHDAIITAAHHRRLATMLAGTVDIPLVFQAFRTFGTDEIERSDLFHHLIAGAMARREGRRAAALMAEHIAQGRDAVLDSIAVAGNTEEP